MTNFDEDSSVYNETYEVEVLIDRPIAQVWKQFLDIPSWVTSHHIENIYGEPGTVGSITRVSFKKAKELAMPPPHYHYCKLIQVLPQKQWVLKTYSERGGSYGFDMKGFDDGRVFAIADKTRVTFNLFIEYTSEVLAKQLRAANADPNLKDASRNGMQKNLENLKRIVESQPRDR